MSSQFSDRITDVPRSFIREILKDALQPGTISFAGGLPNRDLFPLDDIQAATNKVFNTMGRDVLQYSDSEGYLPLRKLIAQRYAERGLTIAPESILITSGSQQGLDLLGKTLINEGDPVIIEEPGYLGAIQAFSMYRPQFLPVQVTEQGMDTSALEQVLARSKPKLMYTVPNFQNPSGITYPTANRKAIAAQLQSSGCILIEDDPYGALRFSGEHQESFYNLLPNQTVLLGSFSKTVVPGFRIGWIVAPSALLEKLIVAKQASDLHTNQLSQCVIAQYLQDYDTEAHIQKIIHAYGSQKAAMVSALQEYFPADTQFTKPEGGMFLWATLTPGLKATELFQIAAKEKVLFVPGDPFYINRKNVNTLRLNFTCADTETIGLGIKRLAEALTHLQR